MTYSIRLNNGGPALIDEEDWPRLSGYGWHVMSAGYVGAMTSRPNRTLVLLHRMIMNPPPGLQIDHINGDKMDNRKSNLRICTNGVNQRNLHRLKRTNKSGVLGVSPLRSGGWRATIRVGGRYLHLGQYATVIEAAEARWDAEIRYFGALFPLSAAARRYFQGVRP